MTESKEFRAGTRMLRWEKDRLSMELEDLQARWTDIQQTKLSKASRQALQQNASTTAATRTVTGGANLTEEYARLDETSRSAEDYLASRFRELEKQHADLRTARAEKEAENRTLEEEVADLEAKLEADRIQLREKEQRLREAEGPNRFVQLDDAW